ncbi:MAG: hypothetical protein ACK5OX_12690, partial [Desertimonas sp.]
LIVWALESGQYGVVNNDVRANIENWCESGRPRAALDADRIGTKVHLIPLGVSSGIYAPDVQLEVGAQPTIPRDAKALGKVAFLCRARWSRQLYAWAVVPALAFAAACGTLGSDDFTAPIWRTLFATGVGAVAGLAIIASRTCRVVVLALLAIAEIALVVLKLFGRGPSFDGWFLPLPGLIVVATYTIAVGQNYDQSQRPFADLAGLIKGAPAAIAAAGRAIAR